MEGKHEVALEDSAEGCILCVNTERDSGCVNILELFEVRYAVSL